MQFPLPILAFGPDFKERLECAICFALIETGRHRLKVLTENLILEEIGHAPVPSGGRHGISDAELRAVLLGCKFSGFNYPETYRQVSTWYGRHATVRELSGQVAHSWTHRSFGTHIQRHDLAGPRRQRGQLSPVLRAQCRQCGHRKQALQRRDHRQDEGGNAWVCWKQGVIRQGWRIAQVRGVPY